VDNLNHRGGTRITALNVSPDKAWPNRIRTPEHYQTVTPLSLVRSRKCRKCAPAQVNHLISPGSTN